MNEHAPGRQVLHLATQEITDLFVEGHPEDALVALESLLLDRQAILTRIGWLNGLAGRTDQPFRSESLEQVERDYAEELQLLDSGLLDAYLEDNLPADWCARFGHLARAPPALWVAHQYLATRPAAEERGASQRKGNGPDELLAKLRALKETFFPRTRVPPVDRWKELDDNAIWKGMVAEIMAAGRSQPVEERFLPNAELQERIAYTTLASFGDDDEARTKAIHGVLREAGIRYAARDQAKCRKTDAIAYTFQVVRKEGGPKAFLGKVADLAGDQQKIDFLLTLREGRRRSRFGPKSARDFLMEHGLLQEALALDKRVMNVLGKLGVTVDSKATQSEAVYVREQARLLAALCWPLDMKGVEFDRMVYQNYPDILHWLERYELGTIEAALLDCDRILGGATRLELAPANHTAVGNGPTANLQPEATWSGLPGTHPLLLSVRRALGAVKQLRGRQATAEVPASEGGD